MAIAADEATVAEGIATVKQNNCIKKDNKPEITST